jgi:acyl-CoA reductase-like NAD-dependent aldehyde dehydrogenase
MQGEGGNFVVEGGVLQGKGYESGCYVKPAIAEVKNHYEIVQHETFAPILYLVKYKELADAIEMQKCCSTRFVLGHMTTNLREAEKFLSPEGSDCGIANVNIGTSGAEIGGAFGEKKTQAAAGKAVVTHGKYTCAARPTPSITAINYRWPRASNSIFDVIIPLSCFFRPAKKLFILQ